MKTAINLIALSFVLCASVATSTDAGRHARDLSSLPPREHMARRKNAGKDWIKHSSASLRMARKHRKHLAMEHVDKRAGMGAMAPVGMMHNIVADYGGQVEHRREKKHIMRKPAPKRASYNDSPDDYTGSSQGSNDSGSYSSSDSSGTNANGGNDYSSSDDYNTMSSNAAASPTQDDEGSANTYASPTTTQGAWTKAAWTKANHWTKTTQTYAAAAATSSSSGSSDSTDMSTSGDSGSNAAPATSTTDETDDGTCSDEGDDDEEEDDDDDEDCSDDSDDSQDADTGSANAGVTANVAAATATAAAIISSATRSSSSGASNQFSGTATWFTQNGNAGACGTVHQDSDKVVALYTSDYSNGAHCGKYVTLTNTANGKSVTALVADECPTCGGSGDIDLSQGTFDALGNESAGVLSVKWGYSS